MSHRLPEHVRVKLLETIKTDDAETLGRMLTDGEGGLHLAYRAPGISSLAFLSVSRHGVRCLKHLISAGAPLSDRITSANGEEHKRRTLLNQAIGSHSLEAAAVLLDGGADPRMPDSSGNTPLHILASMASRDVAPRFDTTVEELLALARRLVAAGCPIHQANHKGATAFSIAQMVHAPLPFLEGLLQMGANPNAPNGDGCLPLNFTCKRGDLPFMRLLVSYGADVNGRDRRGFTPLHHVGDLAALQELVSLGGNLHAVDNEGLTVFHWMLANPRGRDSVEEMLAYLLAAGVDPRQPDFADETALQYMERAYPEDSPLRAAVSLAVAGLDARNAMRDAAAGRIRPAVPQ